MKCNIKSKKLNKKDKLLVVCVKDLTEAMYEEIKKGLSKNPEVLICDDTFHLYTIEKGDIVIKERCHRCDVNEYIKGTKHLCPECKEEMERQTKKYKKWYR